MIFDFMNFVTTHISNSIDVARTPVNARTEKKNTIVFFNFKDILHQKIGAHGRTRTATPAIGHGF